MNVAHAQNEELAAELRTYIEAKMQQNNIPGLSACIVKEGQIVWQDAFGFADVDAERPVDMETLFTLASISKLFVGTACLQLWEQGLLDLDADINEYLPIEIKNPNFPTEIITARQLLMHKSGLRDYESDLQLWDGPGDPIYDLETFCTEYFLPDGSLYVASNWGQFAPGSADYWYSNAGFTLLGYVIAEASGMPFNEYCRENIQLPLGMETAGWFYENIDTEKMAIPYKFVGGGFESYGLYSVPEYPAAMLKSNLPELANFLIAFTNEGKLGGVQLLQKETVELMLPADMTNGLAWWGSDTWYGDQDGNYWGHGGFMNGVRTQLSYYPATETGLLILTNGQSDYGDIHDKMESMVASFIASPSPVDERAPGTLIGISPNPTSEQLQIAHTIINGQFAIFDLSGSKLAEGLLHEQINLRGLSKGNYVLHIYDEHGKERAVQQFVKQ